MQTITGVNINKDKYEAPFIFSKWGVLWGGFFFYNVLSLQEREREILVCVCVLCKNCEKKVGYKGKGCH